MGRQFLAVGENRRLLTKVTEQARHDPLTGLANRTPLYERLHHAMQLRERDVLCVGVLSLDLNDFKLVNDTFGHQAGDELLTLVAKRLVSSVRASDTVARLGGDEFVVSSRALPIKPTSSQSGCWVPSMSRSPSVATRWRCFEHRAGHRGRR